MTKEEALGILKLLSALEAVGLLQTNRVPDYLYEDISRACDVLQRVILE